jgi:DNA-binding response OmpR family regulator
MNKILVIDHDDTFRATLAGALAQQGFEVLQAGTGAEGMKTARAERPNLILCDVDLQGIGGNLILFAVRKDPQLAAVPFVLMSRFAVSEASPPGLDKGADGYLAKPFTTASLASTIDECLTRRDEPGEAEFETHSAPGQTWEAAGPGSWQRIRDALKPVMEATRILSTAYQQLDRHEMGILAMQAHQGASQLYQRVEHWMPALETAH